MTSWLCLSISSVRLSAVIICKGMEKSFANALPRKERGEARTEKARR
jgi:hypothetical protein